MSCVRKSISSRLGNDDDDDDDDDDDVVVLMLVREKVEKGIRLSSIDGKEAEISFLLLVFVAGVVECIGGERRRILSRRMYVIRKSRRAGVCEEMIAFLESA